MLRQGGVWGIANTAVRGIRVNSGEYRIRLSEDGGGTELTADQVLGVVEDLAVWPAAAVLRRYWTQPSGGVSIHGGSPLVVIDPRQPPQALKSQEGEVSDGDAS